MIIQFYRVIFEVVQEGTHHCRGIQYITSDNVRIHSCDFAQQELKCKFPKGMMEHIYFFIILTESCTSVLPIHNNIQFCKVQLCDHL